MINYEKNKKNIFFLLLAFINILGYIAFATNNYDSRAKIIFFDVGQGDSTLILAENDNQVLIDGGDGKKIMDKLGQYMPFYDHTIELLVITHPDSDHIGGLVEVIQNYDVKEVMQTKYSCDSDICKELDAIMSKKKILKRYAAAGQTIYAGNQTLQVLFPEDENISENDDNDNSIVLRADINGKAILLMADAGFKTENSLMERNVNLRADMLRISHHGSKNATSLKFIEKVSSKKAIVSVGKNKYGHPSQDVLNRLKNINISVLRTDEVGDISVE